MTMLESLDHYCMVTWTGDQADPAMMLHTVRGEQQLPALTGHSVITYNEAQTLALLCDTPGSHTVAAYRAEAGEWIRPYTHKHLWQSYGLYRYTFLLFNTSKTS